MNQPATMTSTGRTIPIETSAPTVRACDLSLIIPTRDEEKNLSALFEKLSDVLAGKSYELILVDDSDDATAEVAPRLAAEYGLSVSVIHREGDERLGGLSTAAVAGIAAANGMYVCIMDADLQHPPELISSMLDTVAEGEVDIVIASRYVEGGSDAGLSGRARRAISRISKRLVKTVLGSKLRTVTDPLSGFFLARRSLLDDTALRPIGFKILLDILVRSDWELATEVPLKFEQRAAGSSKATFKQGSDFLAHVARLVWEIRTGEINVRTPAPLPAETHAPQARS